MTKDNSMESIYAYLQSKDYYNVKIVDNSPETIACLKTMPFDCVILDVPIMSDLNLLPLTKVARHEIILNNSPKIILIYDSDALIKALERAGLDEFLHLSLKAPVEFKHLLEAIDPNEPA